MIVWLFFLIETVSKSLLVSVSNTCIFISSFLNDVLRCFCLASQSFLKAKILCSLLWKNENDFSAKVSKWFVNINKSTVHFFFFDFSLFFSYSLSKPYIHLIQNCDKNTICETMEVKLFLCILECYTFLDYITYTAYFILFRIHDFKVNFVYLYFFANW